MIVLNVQIVHDVLIVLHMLFTKYFTHLGCISFYQQTSAILHFDQIP